MVVVVSLEDAALIRELKWKRDSQQQKEAQADTIALIDPDEMPVELLEEAYELTTGTTDFDIQSWRYKAYFSLKGRTGKNPPRPFGPSG